MDEKTLKNRIYAFQFAGVLNLFLGLYVLLYGGEIDTSTRLIMLCFFFGFAVLDFWFPVQLKKNYAKQMAALEQARAQQAQGAAAAAPAATPPAEPPKP